MQSEPSPNPRAPEPAVGCREAQVLIAHFVHRSPRGRTADALRAHLTRCGECSRIYRETLATAANLGRTLREGRLREEKRDRRARHRRLARGVGSVTDGRFGMRLFLTAAGMFLVFTLLRPALGGESDFVARLGRGEVVAAGEELGPGDPGRPLERGDWLVTGLDAEASAGDDETELRLGGQTRILLEEPGTPRVRLAGGRIDVRGSCVVTSQLGVVEIEEGAARLDLRSGELLVECHTGRLEVVLPTGRIALGPGDSRRIDLETFDRPR